MNNIIAYNHNRQPNLNTSCDDSGAHTGNTEMLQAYASWCDAVIQARLHLYFDQDCPVSSIYEVEPPKVERHQGALAQFVRDNQIDFCSQLLLALALMPVVRPQVLDILLMRNDNIERPYTEFGGIDYQDMTVATGETLAFLLGGNGIPERMTVLSLMTALIAGEAQSLPSHQAAVIATLDEVPERLANPLKAPLMLSPDSIARFTTGEAYHHQKGQGFPAQLVSNPSAIDSVILPSSVSKQLDDIAAWAQYGNILREEWGMANHVRPGYRVLFYGPSGTGKTMTAGALGNVLGRDVYKVDLSMVHSKYIGETERNLERVFSLAEQNGWILFFDEADAVFGKRTQTSNANDQFANQNVSYLLQRIECFDGLIILASNYKDNLDEAFYRRFESIVHFANPGPEERLLLWQRAFPKNLQLEGSIQWQDIAMNFPLSGAAINNVARLVALKALSEQRMSITHQELLAAIHREQGSKSSTRW